MNGSQNLEPEENVESQRSEKVIEDERECHEDPGRPCRGEPCVVTLMETPCQGVQWQIEANEPGDKIMGLT